MQSRVGRNGVLFKLFKFATMLKVSSSIGTGTVTMKDDPRILPVGKFLRKTKINELPQLLNVFLGDMSLIGPRPQTPSCFEVFSKTSQEEIVKLRPGLSGIGPIIFRQEESILAGNNNNLDFYNNVIGPYKGNVEAWYVERQSMAIYFTLILLTVWVVIFSNSSLIWKLFKSLPEPPHNLQHALNFPISGRKPTHEE